MRGNTKALIEDAPPMRVFIKAVTLPLISKDIFIDKAFSDGITQSEV